MRKRCLKKHSGGGAPEIAVCAHMKTVNIHVYQRKGGMATRNPLAVAWEGRKKDSWLILVKSPKSIQRSSNECVALPYAGSGRTVFVPRGSFLWKECFRSFLDVSYMVIARHYHL